MPVPHEKLAAALSALRDRQRSGRRVFQSKEFTRTIRERLLATGFLQEIVKGWLISSSPDTQDGDSTPWFASFWEFCARYCEVRFGRDWHLSPELSLMLHAENSVIPAQVIIHSAKGSNHKLDLPFGTSLFDLKSRPPLASDLMMRDGLRIYTPEAALVRVPEGFFLKNPMESQAVLASIGEPTALLRRLLTGGHSVVAGRLVAAFRRMGRADVAGEIRSVMKSAGYAVREIDPFSPNLPFVPSGVEHPFIGRLRAMWHSMRAAVIDVLPPAPGLPRNPAAHLRAIDGIYQSDAYHSLSIEGYKVSVELVERVRSGKWNPVQKEADRRNRDALAARGYWQAFRSVRAYVGAVITADPAVPPLRSAHGEWYRELFQPCVAAGLIPPAALAGYRDSAVFLRASRYVPPRWEVVESAMRAYFSLRESEPDPGVRAVLGHWMFGYIHPYPDGNGRMARFIMNAELVAAGFPWTIVRVEDRSEYLSALDSASIGQDIRPFATFLAERLRGRRTGPIVTSVTAQHTRHQ